MIFWKQESPSYGGVRVEGLVPTTEEILLRFSLHTGLEETPCNCDKVSLFDPLPAGGIVGGGGSGSLMFLLVGVIISSLFPLFTSSLCVSCVKKTNSAVQWKSMHVCESSAASERNTSRRCTRTIDFSTVSGPSNTCGPTTRPPTPTLVWVL